MFLLFFPMSTSKFGDNLSDDLAKSPVKVGRVLAILLSLCAHRNAASDVSPGVEFAWEGNLNRTRKPSSILSEDLPPLVHVTQAFDTNAWPDTVLKLDCRTDTGSTVPQVLLGPNQFYSINPDISSDPTVCWSCAVRWERANRWNNFWVYSHGICEMPLACVQCFWNVDEQGFYLYNPQLDEYIHIWPWNFPIPPTGTSDLDQDLEMAS